MERLSEKSDSLREQSVNASREIAEQFEEAPDIDIPYLT
jgi:hypothetical protein